MYTGSDLYPVGFLAAALWAALEVLEWVVLESVLTDLALEIYFVLVDSFHTFIIWRFRVKNIPPITSTDLTHA